MEKQTHTATYLTHAMGENDKHEPVLTLTFILNEDNSVAEVSIQSPKYVKFLSENIEDFKGVETYGDIAERVKAKGEVELYFTQSAKFIGYSLTDSAYISTKTHVATKSPYGEQVLITDVEFDDSAIAIHFEDGTISKRNFTTKLTVDGEDKYFPAHDKKLRFLQSLGIKGDLTTFDLNDLIGGRCDYLRQDSNWGAWFKHENFTPKQDFSRDTEAKTAIDPAMQAQLEALQAMQGK